MVHTAPDYSSKFKLVRGLAGIDGNEIAARLGSPITWDRRGNVQFYDNFEATTLKCYSAVAGATGTYELSTVNSYRGDNCVKITTGAAEDDYAGIRRRFEVPPSDRYGFEYTFAPSATLKDNIFEVGVHTEIDIVYAGIKHVRLDKKVYYWASDATWKETGIDWAQFGVSDRYYHAKFVVDLNLKEYIRVIYGNQEVSLVGTSMDIDPAAGNPNMNINIYHTAGTDGAEIGLVDNFIITNNEP